MGHGPAGPPLSPPLVSGHVGLAHGHWLAQQVDLTPGSSMLSRPLPFAPFHPLRQRPVEAVGWPGLLYT